MMDAIEIVVGQRIMFKGDMCNASGNGVVFAVRRVENPPRMYRLSTMQQIDASVQFDVVLADGRRMLAVIPGSVGGEFSNKTQRFMWMEGVADGEEVAALVANAAVVAAQKQAAKDEAALAFERAKGLALAAGLELGLTPAAEFKGRGSAAAANLRKELKAAGIKASVAQDGYDCIRVRLGIVRGADGGVETAKGIAAKYQAGSFDGMTDCYEYARSAWGTVFGDVRYVFVSDGRGYMV